MYVLIFFLWMILNGQITAELIVFGLIISAVFYAFLIKVFAYSPKTDLRILQNIPLLILYTLNLIFEIIKAALAVISIVFSLKKKPDPVIVEFRSGLSGNFSNVLLANSITLTPGTYTVFQEKDRFIIHCLRREYAEGLDDSSFIHLLRRLK